MTAGLETAIFAVSGLGVEDLAAIFTLDSAHTGVTINEIFHQGVLIFAFQCLVGDQNDHQLNLLCYGWMVSGQFVHLPLPSGELRFS